MVPGGRTRLRYVHDPQVTRLIAKTCKCKAPERKLRGFLLSVFRPQRFGMSKLSGGAMSGNSMSILTLEGSILVDLSMK